jgi:hypothetical protein
MVLSETRGLQLSSVIRGGIGLRRRLRCAKAHLAYHPNGYSPSNRASQEPDWPTLWMIRSREPETAQAACCFKCLASKLTPFFQMISVIAAIFLATVRRAIVGFIPLARKAS